MFSFTPFRIIISQNSNWFFFIQKRNQEQDKYVFISIELIHFQSIIPSKNSLGYSCRENISMAMENPHKCNYFTYLCIYAHFSHQYLTGIGLVKLNWLMGHTWKIIYFPRINRSYIDYTVHFATQAEFQAQTKLMVRCFFSNFKGLFLWSCCERAIFSKKFPLKLHFMSIIKDRAIKKVRKLFTSIKKALIEPNKMYSLQWYSYD